MSVKTKLIIFISTVFIIVLTLFAGVCILVAQLNNTVNIATNEADIPYQNDTFCFGIITEKHLLFLELDFSNEKSNITCIKQSDVNNCKQLLDNFIVNSKNIFDYDIDKVANFKNNDLEEIINTIGGITALNKDGDEIFILGQEFVNIFENDDNEQYLSYLFGILFKYIFEQKHYEFLYEHSDLSYVDIYNNEKLFYKSLQQIDCITYKN